MKTLLLILALCSIAEAQDLPARRMRLDSSRAFSKNYGDNDTTWRLSRERFTRPAKYDSSATVQQLLADPTKVLEVDAGGKRKYTTIQSAVSAATYGSVVLVHPGTYTGNVTIADSGISVVALSAQSTIVTGTFTVTAKKTRVVGLRFDSTFTHNSQYIYSLHEWNTYERCIFSSDVFIGTATVENRYGFEFDGCNFVGYSDTLYVNQTGGWLSHAVIRDGFMMSEDAWDVYGRGYNLVLKSGTYLRFMDCTDLLFNSIYFDCADSMIVLEIEKCRTVLIGSGNITAVNNASNYAVLSMNYGLLSNWGHSDPWTFSNLFEIDFRWCSLWLPDVVFNSTAQSRIEYCEQRGYGSTSTITGTGLAQLHISNSIFAMDAPTGLGTNRGNGWVQFIDN